MKTSLKQQDYHNYTWKKGEFVRTVFVCMSATGGFTYFFYRSFWA